MKKTYFGLTIIIFIFSIALNAQSESRYPQTREERQSEEIGSLLNGEGIVFRPGHIRNETTKNSDTHNMVNKYLWQAARQAIKFMPIASVDVNNGIIITDWYSTKSTPHYAFKIEINITGDIISPESIRVSVYERKLQNSQWYNELNSKELAYKFEDQIIRTARELYIHSSQK